MDWGGFGLFGYAKDFVEKINKKNYTSQITAKGGQVAWIVCEEKPWVGCGRMTMTIQGHATLTNPALVPETPLHLPADAPPGKLSHQIAKLKRLSPENSSGSARKSRSFSKIALEGFTSFPFPPYICTNIWLFTWSNNMSKQMKIW